jgi:hypothetical protein
MQRGHRARAGDAAGGQVDRASPRRAQATARGAHAHLRRRALPHRRAPPSHAPRLCCPQYKGAVNTSTGDYRYRAQLRKPFFTNTPTVARIMAAERGLQLQGGGEEKVDARR